MSQNSAATKVQEYIDDNKKKAEELVLKGFAEKVIELNELLETPLFKKDIAEIHKDEPFFDPYRSPMLKEEVSCNRSLIAITGLVKLQVCDFLKKASMVRMWIMCMIPKIESGDNFGVEIIQSTLDDVVDAEEEVTDYFNDISRYFMERAKLVSKNAKYPEIDDYRNSVAEIDEKHFHNFCRVISEIRNKYCYFHNFIIKNLEKFQNPRPDNDVDLYYGL